MGCSVSSHAYNHFRADCDGLCDYLRDIPWEDIFELGASSAAGEFCELVQDGIGFYIPHTSKNIMPGLTYLHGSQLRMLLS